jgi:hypothetical protein
MRWIFLTLMGMAAAFGVAPTALAQDTIKIQSEFFQDQMRLLTNQARAISESAMKAATGAFMPKS